MRYSAKDKEEALAKLKEMLPPSSTVHCVLRHVSRSGMSRSISVFAFAAGENAPIDITYWASRALGESVDQKHGGIRMGGCGMDMGFALVYNLSSVLYPHGFGCIGEGNGYGTRCPSNDHSNGDRDYTPHKPDAHSQVTGGRNHVVPARPHWHASGGYALRHRWM